VTGRTDHAVVVHAPMDVVWRMTNDVPSWPHLFTEYAEAEVLEQDGNTVRIRLRTHPDENGAQFAWESVRTLDPATRTVRARRMTDAGPFARMDILWTYREVDAGVEMRWQQDFHVRDGLPFGDKEMAAHLQETTVVQMDAVRDRVEAAARSVPG
jgi:aromatase